MGDNRKKDYIDSDNISKSQPVDLADHVSVDIKDNFIVLLKKEGVRFDKNGQVRLHDLVLKIIKSKKPDLYIERTKRKILVGDIYFISINNAYSIVTKGNSKICRNISNKLISVDIDRGNIIDVSQNLFQYDGRKFVTFFVDDDNKFGLWVHGAQICQYLGHRDEAQALSSHVTRQNKITLGILLESLKTNYNKSRIPHNAIFINYDGLLQLICKSRKPSSIDFALFLNIPVARKHLFHETEIMKSLFDFFYASEIKYVYQYPVKKYRVDCYLTDYNISIEIDEKGHSDRDQSYEEKRERIITRQLGCTFLRCNPDHPNFSIFSFIGDIVRIIKRDK
jgi:very-short-patch-repair endonuclease